MKEFRLVAFGDSLTYGYGVLSHIAYPSRLARELPEKNPQLRWKVYNRGINGETTREAKERLESQVLWLKPHLTVILLGSNDSALNEGQYRTPWEYEHNMMFILERLLAEKHGDSAFHSGVCLPVLVTPPPHDFHTVDCCRFAKLFPQAFGKIRHFGKAVHLLCMQPIEKLLRTKFRLTQFLQKLLQFGYVHGFDINLFHISILSS